jgi:hypothetical protein
MEVASAEAKQSQERQGDYRSVQKQPRAPRRRGILYSFVGAVPTVIGSFWHVRLSSNDAQAWLAGNFESVALRLRLGLALACGRLNLEGGQ